MQRTPLERVALQEPVTHSLALIGAGGARLRVSVLDEDLIRVQYLPAGVPSLDRTWIVVGKDGAMPREGRPRDDLSPFPLPAFTWRASAHAIELETRRLQATIHLDDVRIEWRDAAGAPFAADLAGRGYGHEPTGAVAHHMARRAREHYYGLGERAGELDRAGRRIQLRNVDAFGYDARTTDPLYKHVPFYITFLPDRQLAYGLLYDNLATTTFDFAGEGRGYLAEAGDVDYYLIYGPRLEQVVERLAALTGRMTLPPRWSLGYLGSTMVYTEAADAQDQLKRFPELCRAHRIPCDLFHLSSGYTTDAADRRNVFTWNRHKFPDPDAMVAQFHAAGIKLAANVKPCLLTSHPGYAEVAARGGFVRTPDGSAPQVGPFWGGAGSFLDFTRADDYAWWKHQARTQVLDHGIDAIWNDNNEYEIAEPAARCDGFGASLPIGVARPLQTLLMARASYEALQEAHPDARPFVLSRSGCPGIQRYAQTWSGDNATSWDTLRYNIPMGLGLGLSGAPNLGHDVGGFAGPAPSPELLVRWVQNGVLHPRFTLHSFHSDGSINEPWMYPEVLPIIRSWIEWRYRLIPYLYSVMFEAAQTGHPILRPMVYAFPDDPRCHTESFDFLLGPHLLVASVLEDGARSRRVYLPAGTAWCDLATGTWHAGGDVIELDAPLDRLPLLAPAGGIIPMGRGHERQIQLFPHPASGHGSFALIEDDGVSLAYQRGGYTTVALALAAAPGALTLEVHAHGGYPLPYTTLDVVLPRGETRPLRGDGITASWEADGQRHLRWRLEPA
jgi:alpha-glucosidase